MYRSLGASGLPVQVGGPAVRVPQDRPSQQVPAPLQTVPAVRQGLQGGREGSRQAGRQADDDDDDRLADRQAGKEVGIGQ